MNFRGLWPALLKWNSSFAFLVMSLHFVDPGCHEPHLQVLAFYEISPLLCMRTQPLPFYPSPPYFPRPSSSIFTFLCPWLLLSLPFLAIIVPPLCLLFSLLHLTLYFLFCLILLLLPHLVPIFFCLLFFPHVPRSFALPVPVCCCELFCLPGVGGLSLQVSSASQSRALASKETSQGKVSSLSILPTIITSSLFCLYMCLLSYLS